MSHERMLRYTSLPRLLFVSLALGACSGQTTPDAGPDVNQNDNMLIDVVAPDVVEAAVDASVADAVAPARIFGRCTQDSDCAGAGAICLTEAQGYPLGQCSRPCDDATNPCPTDVPGIFPLCLPRGPGGTNVCLRSCLNGFDCGRHEGGYTCTAIATDTNICTPSCTDATCTHGTRCNLYTGLCQPTSVTYPPPGSDIGGTCTRSGTMSECRSGLCAPEISATSHLPTGYNSGYCISNCALPDGFNPSNLFPGMVLPQGNCAAGAICFPSGGGLAAQDPGQCVKSCMADTDCRNNEGYFCQRSFTLGEGSATHTYTFTNGFCRPTDCSVAGRTCPSGYSCMIQRRTVSGQVQTVGVCRPSGPEPAVEPGPEAGTEPAVEAGATEPTVDGSTAPDASDDGATAMDASTG